MAWYTGNTLYDTLLIIGFVYAAGIAFSARYGTAAYGGRFGPKSKGIKFHPKLGWVLMELPALIFFPVFFFWGEHWSAPGALAILAIWMVHYLNRALINPMMMRVQPGTPASFNINVVVIGWVVLILHSYLNGAYAGGLGRHIWESDWISDPRFVIGVLVWAAGFTINVWSDAIIRNLRPKNPGPDDPRYRIPEGGLFRFVSCPHYLGELISFVGLSIFTWGLGGVFILAVTAGNLIPRALKTHRWYQKTFPDTYPAGRKAIIPGVL